MGVELAVLKNGHESKSEIVYVCFVVPSCKVGVWSLGVLY